MKVHYPKLYNMAHLLSLNVFTASKGSNNYILFCTHIGDEKGEFPGREKIGNQLTFTSPSF